MGNYIKVIDFWATWCKPCIATMPEFIKAARKNTDSNIIFIAVNIYDIRHKWRLFMQEHKTHNAILDVYLDESSSKKVFEQYFFDSVPHYIIIGKNNKIILSGASNFTDQVLPVLKKLQSN